MLEAFEEPEAFQLIAEERAYQTRALATWLTTESYRQVVSDMIRAYHLGRRAIAVAAYVCPTRYGKPVHFDLQGEAAIVLANASRCRSRFFEARSMMGLATRLLAQGSGDPRLQAMLADYHASLASDLGYYRDALAWNAEKMEISRIAGDVNPRKDLVSRARFVTFLRPSHAVAMAQVALQSIDNEREPWLEFCAASNLVNSLIVTGRPGQAKRILSQYSLFEWESLSTVHWFYLRWYLGRILGQQGQTAQALSILKEVRREFGKREMGGELGALTLHIGDLFLLTGRLDLAQRNYSEAGALFSEIGAEGLSQSVRRLLARQ